MSETSHRPIPQRSDDQHHGDSWYKRTLRRWLGSSAQAQSDRVRIDSAASDVQLDLEATVVSLKSENAELLQKVRHLERSVEDTDGEENESRIPTEQAYGSLITENEVLTERVRVLQETNSKIQARSSILEKDVEVLKATGSGLEHQLREARKDLTTESEKSAAAIGQAKDLQRRLKETRVTLTESRTKVVESLKTTRERLVSTSALWAEARKYFALFRQGLLADEIRKSDIDLGADTYLCLLPSTVPAAMDLQRKYGGRIICDCVENVEVERHSLAPNLHPPALDMINLEAYGALGVVDGLMTVSGAVASTLERFGPPVRVQPNYRRYEEPKPIGSLREQFGLDAESTVIITSGNVVRGFENVIDAMRLLPDNVHLVSLVKLSPTAYDQHIREYLESSGLSHRIHLHGFIPYSELSSFMADADMGIIALDPGNPNHSVSLPNRVFDFTTAGLPFVVPNLPEIAAYVREHNCGVIVDDVDAQSWARAVREVLEDIGSYRESIREARAKVTWEGLDDGLVEFLGDPQSVTMLGFRDLSRYQRFLRVADSLTARGVKVKAAFFSENPAPVANRAVEFYHFTDRYGRGPGLIPVPHENDSSSPLSHP